MQPRLFAIGDVQGCYSALRALLRHIHYRPGQDRLWFVGDLVNRGPDALSVLRYIRDLGARAAVVLGNHDLHLLALAHGNVSHKTADCGLQAVLDAPDQAELCAWLRSRPLLHWDRVSNIAMMHAGLSPAWDMPLARKLAAEVEAVLTGPATERHAYFASLYGDRPTQWRPELSGAARWRYITNALTRLRFVHRDGRLNLRAKQAPEQVDDPDLIPWFAHPERQSQSITLVCGHWSALGYLARHNVYAIDTGCVWGGRLTALQLTGAPQPQPLFIRCDANHRG